MACVCVIGAYFTLVVALTVLAAVRVAVLSEKPNVLGKEAVKDRPSALTALVHVVA